MDKVIRQGLLFSAGFDVKSEKEMKARVSEIIASASNINFDTPENKKSLQSLISVFRDMFESVGNKKIDFAKMLNMPGPEMFDAFKKSANEIADVWADVVSRMGTNSLRNVFMKDERSLSDALERLTKNGKLIETRLKNIKQAFKDVRSADINRLLSDAIGAEVNFNTAETWEERTAAALRYIKVRDKILSMKNSESFNINEIDRHQMDFFKDITDSEHRLGAYFVRDLKEVVPEMQTSLNNIFNLFRKVEIDVVPKVVKVLDIGDILGGKKTVVVDVAPEVNDDGIDADFKQKLESLYDAYQKAQFRLAREIEGDLLSSVPEGLQKALQSKLQSVMGKAVLKDADYEGLWSEFKPYVGTGTGTGTGTGDGSGAGLTEEDVENIRKAAEFSERIEESYKKLEAFDSDPWSIKDEEEVNRLYQERLEIIKNIGAENLKSYDAERYEGVEYINDEYARKLDNFKELKDDTIYKQLDEEYGYDNEIISESKELEVLLAKRHELMQQIYFDAEQEYTDQIEINQAIERRIALMKELEPLVENGSLTSDDLEAIVNERGDLDERRKALFGVQTDLFNAEPDTLDDAQYVLDQYEKILVETASGKKLTLGPEMSEADWKSFMQIDPDKAKSIEFIRKEIQQTGQEIQHQAEVQSQTSGENVNVINGEIEAVEKLRNQLSKILELRELWDTTGGLNYDDPTSSNPEKTIKALTRIKELYSEITGETDTPAIQAIENAISNVESLMSKMQYYKDLEPSWNEDERESLRDNRDVDLRLSIKDIDEDLNAFEKYIPDQYDLQEQLEKITKTQADAEVESNQKKIQSYEELSDAVSRYVELAKSLVDTENKTPEHMQIERDMDIVDTWGMDSQEDFIAVINEWQTNIGKIKAAIKAGADTYRTEDGYVENITDDTLSRAESTLRGYIYRYAENWNDVDSLLAGAKTKTLKNIITKEIGKYTSDQDIQKQQEEIAEAANAAALEEMEQIEKSIEDSALDGKSLSAWEKLSDLKYKSDKVDRYTQSSITDDIAKDLGIVSPHEEIKNNAKAIKSYEELCEVVQRYNDLTKKRVIFAGDKYPTLSAEEENEFADLQGRLNATRDGVKITWREIEGDINKLAQLLGIAVPQAAQQAQQAVGGLNNELQEAGGNADNINNQVEGNVGLSAGSGQTDGVTVDEVQNLEAIRAKVAEITSAVELKTKAFTDEAAAVNTAVESEIKQLGELETKVKSVSETLVTLLNNIKSGESDLGAGLSNIVVNVNNPKEPEGEVSSINQEILNQILNNIYTVQIKSDASNESGIPKEGTAQEPWALEKTLLSVKETLNQIQTNTTPIVESKTPAQPKSTLPETGLSEIKELLGQINNKIVKGTKASAPNAKANNKTKTTQKPLTTAYSQEKKDTQKLSLKKFRTELEESGRLTDELRKKINTLSRSLGQVKDGQALAKWNEQFKQFKLETDISSIKDKYKDKNVISSYKELIAVQKIRNRLELQYEKAKDGSNLKQYYKTQIEDIDKIITQQKIRNKNAEQEKKLTAMQAEQDRKLGAIRASKVDSVNREQEARAKSDAEAKARNAEAKRQLDLKQKESEIVRELIVLWERLGVAKANGDVAEEAKLKKEIKGKRSGLTSVDYATNMKFKHAKEKGFNSVAGDQDAAALSEQQKKIQRLTALYRELGAAEAKLENTKDGAVDNDAIKNNISGLLEQINLEGALNDVLQRQMETTRQLAKEKTKRAQAEAGSRKSLKDEINANKKRASANKVASSSRAGRDILFTATTLDFDFSENNAEVQKLATSLKDLDDLEKRLADNDWVMNKEDREALAQATSEVNKHTESVKLLVNSAKMFGNDNSIDLHRNIGAGNIKAQLIDAANAAHGAKFKFEEFDDELQTITGTLKVGPREFRKVTIGVNQFSGAIRESQGALKKTETFVESFKRKLSEISSYFSASSVIFKAVSMIKQGVQYVRDIDLALTELKKVTNETEEAYDAFLKTAAKTGARLGSTISAVTEATATFAKLGYSMQQASEMAEAAIVYKNVGDNIASTEDAADSIISTLKGFGLAASESMEIVDRFNEVGNKFAITSQGIGEALRLSASALNEGGNTLDESIAMITAANEVVNDPSSVGTALKTLTLRLRGSKTELEAMGEDVSDMATTTSQLQAKLLALTGGKVDIMLDDNTFKNPTQILREMADAWKNMSDIQRASALELMGGKRQANVLSALIQNFDTVEKVIKTSANSSGSALKENERYLDSIQGKIDQFHNATQAMWNDTLNSDAVKFFVDLATKLVKVVDAIGPLNIALVGLFAYIGKQQGLFDGLFKPAEESLESLKQKLTNAKKDLDKATQKFEDSGSAKDLAYKNAQEQRVKDLSKKVERKSAKDTVDNLNKSREELLDKKHTAKLAALGKDEARAELDALADKQIEAQKKVNQAKSDVSKSVLGIGDMPLSDADANLQKAEQELADINAQIERTQRDLDGINFAEQQISQINAQLDQTNRELAEAQAHLAAIDDPELDALIGDRGAFSQEVDAMKAKREELQKAVEAKSSDDMLKLVEIDTTSIDDEIEKTKEKLEAAKQDLLNAQAEDSTKKINGGIRMNPEKDKRVADASKEIAEIEKDLDALQQKKADTIHYAAQFDLAEMDEAIGAAEEKLDGMTDAINDKTAAQTRSNIATNAGAAAEAAGAAATNAGATADTIATATQDAHTASTFRELLAQIVSTKMKWADVKATGKQIILDKLRNSWLIKNAIATGVLTAEQAAAVPITALLSAGIKGLTASISALWVALWPILLIMVIIAAAIAAVIAVGYGLVKLIDWIVVTSKELREELSGLKEEISSIKDELDSLNGELETTQERIAELLAKDSLTFTEKEELEALQKQNDELEREIYLLEQKEKRLQKKAQDTFDDLMGKNKNLGKTKDSDGDGEEEVYDKSLERKIKKYEKWVGKYEEAKQALVSAEQELEAAEQSGNKKAIKKAEKKVEKAEKKVEKAEKKVEKKQGKVDEEFNQYLEDAEGIDYESADTETRKYLDYIYNTEGRISIANGEDQAKSMEIKRIFNKSTMSNAKDEIDELVKKLTKNPEDQTIISQISDQCKLAEKDLKAVGLSVQDATDYFTKLGSNASFNTLEGKISEMQNATSKMQTLLSNTNSADFTGLFNKDGEVLETAIAEYFQGTSEETRAEIARLVKSINDGEISVENALKQFELFSIESSLDIYISEVQTNFKDVFVELEDVDGLIDTFEELANAISSTASALKVFNKAEGEMAKSGRVSIETAMQLMEYTDDYGSILKVVDGKLQLVDNAEEVLIQTRIDAIKTSAQASLSDATNAYNKAQLATQTYRDALTTDMSASVVASAWEKILAAGAGLMAGIKSLLTDESWSEAYNRAYNETLSKMTGYETSYDDAGLQALIDAEADAKKAMDAASDRVELANQLTPETLESINNADDVDSKEDAANDAFQREMDYWENLIAANQAKYGQLQNEIDLLEAKGQKADASFYEEQIKLEKEREWLLGEQKKAAEAHLATLEEGSEEWWEVANTLNDIEGELDDVTASIVDLQDAIGEIGAYKFEEFNNRLDNLTSKLETIRNLIAPDGVEDWFDDEGNWTDKGIGVLGTYVNDLEFFKQGLQESKDALAEFNEIGNGAEWSELSEAQQKEYANKFGVHSEQEYYEKTEELISKQYDYIESISDTEQSIVDMYESSIDAVEEYVDTLIDGYGDYIDSVKEALDAERDLYDFKKNVQKQAKDIAEIERRIASLSGSTNKADIAERRKLEAQLYESRESLNDTYYDHATDAQNEALDAEQEAYETAMTKMVENMRISLEEATTDMASFLDSVTIAVSMNAQTVLDKYRDTEVPLNDAITNPWEEAAEKVKGYGGDATKLMDVWKADGYFAEFKSTASANLSSPWSAGTDAANTFKTSVSTVMSNIVSNISSNVQKAKESFYDLMSVITATEAKAASGDYTAGGSGGNGSGSGSGSGGGGTVAKTVSATAYLTISGTEYSATGTGTTTSAAREAATGNVLQKAYNAYKAKGYDDLWIDKRYSTWKSNVTFYKQVGNTGTARTAGSSGRVTMYAKGTSETPRDEWAITDEPQFGDELVLVPGKDGNLSFMRKGTGVVPADLTANLMEWGQFTPDALNIGSGVNINMINNAVNKPEFNFSFDALVKAERIDENTLPEVKKYVQQEINSLVKQMNYAIKGKGGR